MDKRSHKKDFFSDGKPPSKEEIYRYLDEEMTPEERHALEADLLDSDLFSEAVDGFALVEDRAKVDKMLAGAEKDFLKKLEEKEEDKKGFVLPRTRWLVAAAVGLLFTLFAFLFFDKPDNSTSGNTFAENKPVQEESAEQDKTSLAKQQGKADEDAEGTAEMSDSKSRPLPEPAKKMEAAVPPALEDVLMDEEVEMEAEVMEEIPMEVDDVEVKDLSELKPVPTPNEPLTRDGNAWDRGLSNGSNATTGGFNSGGSSPVELKQNAAPEEDDFADFGADFDEAEESEPIELAGTSTNEAVEEYNYSTVPSRTGNAVISAQDIAPADQQKSKRSTTGRTMDSPVSAYETSGFQKYLSGDYAGAVQHLGLALNEDPGSAKSRYYLALSHMELGQTDLAIQQFDIILQDKNNPYYEDAEWQKAQTQLAANKRAEAEKTLRRIESKRGKYRRKAKQSLEELR